MMILKEAFGWSDAVMFDNCRFNLLVRSSLGLFNLNDSLPATFKKLSGDERALIESLMTEDSQKTVYRGTKDQLTKGLIPIGLLIVRLLKLYRGTLYKAEEYQLLSRVFLDQYEMDGPHRVKLLDNEKITSSSVQSPDDPDASYRNKGNQKFKGYSVNVTKTISDEGYLDLITDVDVRKANTADKAFVKDAIKATAQVTGQRRQTALHRAGCHSSIQETRRNDAAATRGSSKAKQCGGNHLLTRSPVAKCENQIPRHVQTASMGLLQMPVDKLGQNR